MQVVGEMSSSRNAADRPIFVISPAAATWPVPQLSAQSLCVQVGNFEYDASVREVERLFERFGKLDRVEMKTGAPAQSPQESRLTASSTSQPAYPAHRCARPAPGLATLPGCCAP